MTLPVYVIHCRELPERADEARAHFGERGVAARWWRAPHGATWCLATTKEFETGKVISPGHVSLLLAHWNLWQHLSLALPDSESAALVCEDDCVFPDDFHAKLNDLWGELDRTVPDWDFVFVGLAEADGPHPWNKVTERVGGPTSRLCRLEWPWGTHCYLVRRRALPVMMDAFPPAERNMDQQLFCRVLQPGLVNWVAVLPPLVKQRTYDHAGRGSPEWGPSTIEQSAGPPGLVRMGEGELSRRLTGVDVDSPGRPAAAMFAATMSVVDPFPCIYRGEFLDDHGRGRGGRSVPLSQCARLDKSCHSKRVAVASPVYLGRDQVTDCETCPHRREMASDSPRDRLPLPDGHFNPSIAVFDYRLILATRDSWGHSKVALWNMTNDRADWAGAWSASPIGSFGSAHPDAPRLEDPRLLVAPHPATGRETLHAMFNLPDAYPPKLVNVGYVRFAPDLSGIEYTEVFRSPRGNLYEKNWVPFWDGGEIRWVYATKPTHVVLGGSGMDVTPNPLPWTGGVIRGGAAPVLMSPLIAHALRHPRVFDREVCYHFFHGCLKRLQGSVYTVGCCVFEAKPPFRVLRQTPTPLLWPDLPAAGESVVKRYVLWPGGAVPHAGAWHLACGVDDTTCRIIRLPFGAVEAALSDVPEADSGVSIRDTPLAKGVTG